MVEELISIPAREGREKGWWWEASLLDGLRVSRMQLIRRGVLCDFIRVYRNRKGGFGCGG